MDFRVNDAFFYVIDSFTFFTWRLLLFVANIFGTGLFDIFWGGSEIVATWGEVVRFSLFWFNIFFFFNLFFADSLEIAWTCFLG